MFKRAGAFFWGLMGIIMLIGIIEAIGMIIGIIMIIGGSIALFIVSIIYYITLKNNGETKGLFMSKCLIVITTILMVGTIFFGLHTVGYDINISNPFDNSIWAKDYTSIEDFDYYIDGNNIYIKEYKGKSKKVKISSTYTIDGAEYNVVEFTEGVFALKNVYSIILPEGLISMANNTFNSCGVKYVYIPSTLEKEDESYGFYDYFNDVEKIYYGGTEEQWADITNNVERSKIDAVQIICNANVSEFVE